MNASASWFTSYERSLLKTDYGTQKQRLSRDHGKAIDYCCLCLQRARDPVCCASHGDIFCRECAINNLLSQRKEIKRLQLEIEKRHAEEEEARIALEKEAMDRGVHEFEKIQMGLEGRKKRKDREDDPDLDRNGGDGGRNTEVLKDGEGANKRKAIMDTQTVDSSTNTIATTTTSKSTPNGSSTGFSLDENELLRIARSDRQRHKDKLNDEKANAAAPKLPSFWIPSLTPSLSSTEIMPRKPPKLQPVCPASDPDQHHYYSLKTLVALKFEEERDEKNKHGEPTRICPSCRKALSNEVKAIVAKPCGHVLCKPCAQKFVISGSNNNDDDHHHHKTNQKRCFVCEADLTTPTTESKKDKDKEKEKEKIKPGIVQLASDGTGFSGGGGRVLAQRHGVAFQC